MSKRLLFFLMIGVIIIGAIGLFFIDMKKTKKVIKNLRFVNSKESVLIQLADMVAGSERRYFEYRNGIKTDAEIYRNIIKKKIDDEWEFR